MSQDTEMNRSSLRTLLLHRSLVPKLNEETLSAWTPQILQNLERLSSSVQGHPHVENLGRWRRIVETRDVETLRTVLDSPDPGSIEMREVSPMGGLIGQDERLSILKSLPRR
ncbi:hypothetical protein RCG67_01785 [Kocuria sp. CPCC 205292]|uniref:hypothetical protein n=1 Tax=Kocuria cellulosilytica TaxID=3071451 RepID=UPI0034D43301